MGRYRNLPGIDNRRLKGHLERAAINTPIQVGGWGVWEGGVLFIAPCLIHLFIHRTTRAARRTW